MGWERGPVPPILRLRCARSIRFSQQRTYAQDERAIGGSGFGLQSAIRVGTDNGNGSGNGTDTGIGPEDRSS